ncbi:MAG TPA: site-specific integrase, partial [Candidatus Marinimicrobia bacterium]|nr:site-specific integrase [Candidatus Neomarinimicrobiota bacterium]
MNLDTTPTTHLTLADDIPTAGFFETVRKEMRLRNYSVKTIQAYISCLRAFVRYISPSHPRTITEDGIRAYLLHLIESENMAPATINQAYNALRFLYVELYKMPFVIRNLPRLKKERKLPDVLDQEDILK